MWDEVKYQTGFGSEFASEDSRAPGLWLDSISVRCSLDHYCMTVVSCHVPSWNHLKVPFPHLKILLKNARMVSTLSKFPGQLSPLLVPKMQELGSTACFHPPSTGDSSAFQSVRTSRTIGTKSTPTLIRKDGCLSKCRKMKRRLISFVD